MEPKEPLEFALYARSRMRARSLTEAHVLFCMLHPTDTYKVKGITGFICKLPDGRNMKVKAKDVSTSLIVIDVFTYSSNA